jgi:hypothetical protein
MYQEFYQGNGWLGFAVFALVLFVAVFAAVVLRTFFHGPKKTDLDRLANLPFSNDDVHVESSDAPLHGEPRHV